MHLFLIPRHAKYVEGYISLVRSYVQSFVHLSIMFLEPKGQSFCIKVYKTLHYKDPLMDFIDIWHDGRYRSKILLKTISTPGFDLEVKVTDNLHINVNFLDLSLYSYIIKTL